MLAVRTLQLQCLRQRKWPPALEYAYILKVGYAPLLKEAAIITAITPYLEKPAGHIEQTGWLTFRPIKYLPHIR